MRALGATIASALVAVFAAGSVAHAQGQIADIRLGKQPDYDRIVVDLSVDGVDATQTSTADQFILELSASKPSLSLDKENRLEDLKIYLQDSPTGTRMVIEKRNRPVQVFRIVAAPGSGKGDRLVLDVGRAGGRLTFPADAARVPEGSAVATPEPPKPEPVKPEPVKPEPPKPELVAKAPEAVKPLPPKPVETAKPGPDVAAAERNLLDGMGGATRPEPRSSPAPAPVTPKTDAPKERITQAEPPAPQGGGDEDEKGEDVWVLVRAIDIQGVSGPSPSVQDLNELKLAVSPVRGGYVAPRDNKPVQRLPLRALVGDDRNGRRLSGSVLQLIVETIAAEYTRNEKLGTRVDIRRSDLEGLMQGGDGRLVIRVREMPARAAGSAEP
jgi:hypothetical protein